MHITIIYFSIRQILSTIDTNVRSNGGALRIGSDPWATRTTRERPRRQKNVLGNVRQTFAESVIKGHDISIVEPIVRRSDESPIKSNYYRLSTAKTTSSKHPFLLNFSREIAFNLEERRWYNVAGGPFKYREINGSGKAPMIKPRDADEKGREWWRHAWRGGEKENSSCRSHVTGAHIIGSILSISHFLRGSWEESITRFVCVRENMVTTILKNYNFLSDWNQKYNYESINKSRRADKLFISSEYNNLSIV